MKRMTSLFAVLVAAIVAAVPAANAQKVHFLGVGANALYQPFALVAYNDVASQVLASPQCTAAGATCTANHFTLGATALVAAVDAASGAPNENGSSWFVYVTCTGSGCPTGANIGANGTTDIWAYLGLDAVVGIRQFLRRDAAGNASKALVNVGGTAPAGKIKANLFAYAPGNVGDAAALPGDIDTALNGLPFTAALSDNRMEDALYTTLRVLGTCPAGGCNTSGANPPSANGCPSADVLVPATAPPSCSDATYFQSYTLGYGSNAWSLPGPYPGTNQVGTAIQSTQSTAVATPAGFSLPGFADPFSGSVVPTTIQTFPIGESPIIVVANRTNAQGLGGLIGSIPACAANGGGTDNVICVDDPANGGPAYNGGSGAGYTSDGSYLVRNLWDQHPYPAVAGRFPDLVYTPLKPGDGYCGNAAFSGTGPCKESRRPLGSLFGGYLQESASYAFTWPLDSALQGNRVFFPTNGCPACVPAVPVVNNSVPITVFEREPTAGTYLVFEYTEVRRFGGTAGNFDYTTVAPARWIYTPYLSEENFVDGTAANAAGYGSGTMNPMSIQGQNAFQDPSPTGEGFKKRALSTSEEIAAVKATPDSIGYTFFSFGNVSSITTSTSYGYLMIDGVDPLFNNYSAAGALDPGQPATNGNPKSWGELPTCAGSGCKAKLIWDTTHACAGGAVNPLGCSYPHLRDGTYPSWSVLRMICDTAVASCSTDIYGAEAMLQYAQWDVHNNNLGGLPDFLPFSDSAGAGSLCPGCSFNPPFGDVSYIRDHSAHLPSGVNLGGGITSASYDTFVLADDDQDRFHNTAPYLSTLNPQTIHKSINQATVNQLETLCGGGAGVNRPPSAECGGDVGGWIIPVTGAVAAQGQQQ